MITIYTFQSSFFTAFGALKNKTSKNGQLADGLARIIMFLTYTISPLIAFALYGKNIKSNLLLNIAKDTGVIPVILMFLFMVISALTIPIVFFVGKESVLIVFDEITRGSYSGRLLKTNKVGVLSLQIPAHVEAPRNGTKTPNQEHQIDENNQKPDIEAAIPVASGSDPLPKSTADKEDKIEYTSNPKEYLNMKPVYFYVISITLWVIVTILSIVVGDVSVFFGVLGAVAGCYFMFTAPGLFYVIVIHKKKVGLPTTWAKIKYILAWAFVLAGFFLKVTLCM
jgi:amino acid permease